MTRWARGGPANKKKPHDASKWSEIKVTESTKVHKRRSGKAPETFHKKRKTDKGEKLPAKDMKDVWKKRDERRENRRLNRIDKRDKEMVCFNCRQPGHMISECPKARNDMEHGTGICFKCGSTEHSLAQCRVKLPPGEFPYAKCFICGEQGHLSKQCPDNPKGLYPMGGCCKLCGSVEHFKKDCPELQSSQGVGDSTIDRMQAFRSADEEPSLKKTKYHPPVKKGPKVVKF